MEDNSIIEPREIESFFREYCKENRIEFSQQSLKRFLNFLEIDFYDWLRENLNQFSKL